MPRRFDVLRRSGCGCRWLRLGGYPTLEQSPRTPDRRLDHPAGVMKTATCRCSNAPPGFPPCGVVAPGTAGSFTPADEPPPTLSVAPPACPTPAGRPPPPAVAERASPPNTGPSTGTRKPPARVKMSRPRRLLPDPPPCCLSPPALLPLLLADEPGVPDLAASGRLVMVPGGSTTSRLRDAASVAAASRRSVSRIVARSSIRVGACGEGQGGRRR